MNNNETRPGTLFGSLAREQKEGLLKKYPWFDSVRRSVTAEDRLPAHISLQRTIHPAMFVPGPDYDEIPEPGAASAPSEKRSSLEKPEETITESDSPTAGREVQASGKPAEKPPVTTKKQDMDEGVAKGEETENQSAESAVTETAGKKARKDSSTIEIIDTFIDKGEHKIVPNDNTPDKLPADDGAMLPVDDELITEDLAAIYMDQELFAQAIAIYERLSLLYPKKSVYFAEIIERARARMGEDSTQ